MVLDKHFLYRSRDPRGGQTKRYPSITPVKYQPTKRFGIERSPAVEYVDPIYAGTERSQNSRSSVRLHDFVSHRRLDKIPVAHQDADSVTSRQGAQVCIVALQPGHHV